MNVVNVTIDLSAVEWSAHDGALMGAVEINGTLYHACAVPLVRNRATGADGKTMMRRLRRYDGAAASDHYQPLMIGGKPHVVTFIPGQQ